MDVAVDGDDCIVTGYGLVAAAAPLDAPEAGCTQRTALFVASEFGYLAVVETLLAAGADKDATEDDGCTALYVATNA